MSAHQISNLKQSNNHQLTTSRRRGIITPYISETMMHNYALVHGM